MEKCKMDDEYTYKKIRKIILIYFIWLIIFFGVRQLLSVFYIEYRFWLSILGYVVSAITPFILLGWLIKLNAIKNSRIHPIVIISVYSVISCGILLIFALHGFIVMHEERTGKDGTLEVAYGSFLSESHWYSYDKVSFWGRKLTHGSNIIKLLEQKYDCKFKIDTSAFDLGWVRYVPDIYPDLLISAYDKDGLIDNFSEQYLNHIFAQLYNELAIDSERGYRSFENSFYHSCLVTDLENMSILAKDAAALINYMLIELENDINAPCSYGILYVIVKNQDNSQIVVKLPFGDSGELEAEGKDSSFFSKEENVYEELSVRISFPIP